MFSFTILCKKRMILESGLIKITIWRLDTSSSDIQYTTISFIRLTLWEACVRREQVENIFLFSNG